MFRNDPRGGHTTTVAALALLESLVLVLGLRRALSRRVRMRSWDRPTLKGVQHVHRLNLIGVPALSRGRRTDSEDSMGVGLFSVRLMLDLAFETVLQILAVLPYTVISTVVVRVCRKWHELRSSEPFLALRAEVNERGLVFAGGHDKSYYFSRRYSRLCRVLTGGHWREMAPLLPDFSVFSSTLFRGELVVFFNFFEFDHVGVNQLCLAFNLKANAWRTLEWPELEIDEIEACCATDVTVVASLFNPADPESVPLLCSLRSGSAEGWTVIPDPPDLFGGDCEQPPTTVAVRFGVNIASIYRR